MNYRKLNNLSGWVIGGIATLVYLMTMERTASLWDCGEFLSCAYKLEVGHSPGAPFFMLIQRMFGILAMGNTAKVAIYINAWSAIASGLTILFLFWTITHLAKKLLNNTDEEPNSYQRVLIIGAGIVGALAYTFSDTFWFSAVEAEVYATSSFFTALTFWAILKWENVANEKYADRWLVLIAYLMGISVGIHLLNLLTIPAIAMVYYFKKYKTTTKGTLLAFFIGCVALGFVQFGVIQGIPIIASKLDVFFVNKLGLPFNSGALFTIVLIVVGAYFLLKYAKNKGFAALHTATLSVIFILIGFSSYIVPMIRSLADTPIDMTNPDNTLSLVSYVQREQFGSQPLVYGQDYDAGFESSTETGNMYAKSKKDNKDIYEVVGTKKDYQFESDKYRYFPRLYDNNDPNHIAGYKNFLGLADGDRPTSGDNFKYFLGYQMNWMWWRYFMWNYAGRQNDFEGQGEPKNGNWVSGIKPIDQMRGVGDLDKMSDGYKNNGARNELYFLPLILGILGFIFQFNRNRKDGFVVGTLFFFTGIAIGIYLNMPPNQPRERDYAFAGSTYAFAIWIGLGILFINDLIQKFIKGNTGAYAATGLSLLAVPLLMAKVEWKDHDRSNKTIAKAAAYNALMSCEKNAILFTFGDNETYPLWYAQEVEGIRPDVRVINTSLLGIDWYIDQLNYKINDADAVPMIWKRDDYLGERHNYVRYLDKTMLPTVQNTPANVFVPLKDICQFIVDPKQQVVAGAEGNINYFPTKNFYIPSLPISTLIANGLLNAGDTAGLTTDIKFTYGKDMATKDQLAELNIIAANAANGWKRPIYFSNLQELGAYGNLNKFMQLDGTVYRLVPFSKAVPSSAVSEPGFVNLDKSYNLFMNTYLWGGGERKDVYFDEKNRQMFIPYRIAASRIADNLTAIGKKEQAVKVLDKVMASITEESYAYDIVTFYIAQSYFKAGALDKAKALTSKLSRNAQDDVNYILSLSENGKESMFNDAQKDMSMLNMLIQSAKSVGDSTTSKNLEQTFNNLATRIQKGIDIQKLQGGNAQPQGTLN